MTPAARKIRVLIVDDSAFARKTIRALLMSDPQVEVVGVARDGEEALELAAAWNPDVITCDLNMPHLDGVGFVRRQMTIRPLPIVMLTAAPQDADKLMEALAAGAVDLVQKPTALATDELLKIGNELKEKLMAAAGVAMEKLAALPLPPLRPQPVDQSRRVDVVLIGISTGGPQALRQMLPLFPPNFPVPIAIVLHMPVGYTALFAEKLDEICQIKVREAREGDLLTPGLALVAPAGRHLRFRRLADRTVAVTLSLHPMEKIHRPSVDVMFQSAVEIYRNRVLGVVMTGMGDDGKEGAAWIKAEGGAVLTEAEKSCVIYGMPRSVLEAGLSDASVSLPDMAQAITERL